MASQSTELMFLPLGGTQITSNTWTGPATEEEEGLTAQTLALFLTK